MSGLPLVHQRHFAHAARDTGYKSTAAAVSEIVDNAVQANATAVDIHILETRVDGVRTVKLAVLDDGCGMSRADLQQALQWGGSSRFNDRAGLGRFGMGLPNSSVSQAKRVEVYTWQDGARPLFCYLDLDEVEAGALTEIPRPTRRYLPKWLEVADPESGTLVLWSKCDRIDYRKAKTLERKLGFELGRIFRRVLWDGLRLTINGRQVPGIDPLFLDPRAPVSGAAAPLPSLEYEVRSSTGTPSRIRVNFSVFPIRKWRDWPTKKKRSYGIVGRAGVSIIRARREIAHGWYFMDGKKRQNYDDWWRVEIEFEPELDELMGVTHSKQGIRAGRTMNEILSPEIGKVARDLSARVRDEFAVLNSKAPTASAVRAASRDERLPHIPVPTAGNGRRVAHLGYRIEVTDSAQPDFFTWDIHDDELTLVINKNHPFFRSMYRPLDEAGLGWIKTDLELVLLAYSRAEALAQSEELDAASALRTHWSDVVATFLGD